jgi:hypothetical protein
MWSCAACGESCEDEFDACWRCAKPALPEPPREIDCIRCRARLVPDGTESFQEGANWHALALGGLSGLTADEVRFERYRCPGCGRVELVAAP